MTAKTNDARSDGSVVEQTKQERRIGWDAQLHCPSKERRGAPALMPFSSLRLKATPTQRLRTVFIGGAVAAAVHNSFAESGLSQTS
jgi:hypothetical protein